LIPAVRAFPGFDGREISKIGYVFGVKFFDYGVVSPCTEKTIRENVDVWVNSIKKHPSKTANAPSHLARATPAIAAHADGSRVRRLATTQT